MKYFSLLDLSPIIEGGDAALAFRNTLDLARHAEEWGYHRYWLAEHHNLPGIASAATSIVIGHVAGGTKRIRVGAGGIMLPNHAPLVIAEQFGTLDALYPGRIDLGLGRAPGSDQLTARALRRNLGSNGDTFPQDVLELQSYFAPAEPEQALQAVPGAGANVPLYLLGSSDFSARLAAELGLPFAFASHFAPAYLDVALALYRQNFKPSAALAQPHAMIGVGIFAAADGRGSAASCHFRTASISQHGSRPPGQTPATRARAWRVSGAGGKRRQSWNGRAAPRSARRKRCDAGWRRCSRRRKRTRSSPPRKFMITRRGCARLRSPRMCSPDSLAQSACFGP